MTIKVEKIKKLDSGGVGNECKGINVEGWGAGGIEKPIPSGKRICKKIPERRPVIDVTYNQVVICCLERFIEETQSNPVNGRTLAEFGINLRLHLPQQKQAETEGRHVFRFCTTDGGGNKD